MLLRWNALSAPNPSHAARTPHREAAAIDPRVGGRLPAMPCWMSHAIAAQAGGGSLLFMRLTLASMSGMRVGMNCAFLLERAVINFLETRPAAATRWASSQDQLDCTEALAAPWFECVEHLRVSEVAAFEGVADLLS